MPVLKLSFDNLDSPSLKQCFAYCSLFKKDFEIQKDNLIQLWMAQGLLHPSPGESKDMEDIGNEYFDILLQSSLFQDATVSDNGIVSKCKMHDLVHDMTELVSKSESLTSDLCGIDNTLEIRLVAQVSTSLLNKIPEISARKLRSLFFDGGEVPSNILPRFTALRVLNLSNANIEEFPISVGRMKHLRYLDISKTRFKEFPNSIGKLYNLQTLRATNCALKEFPKELQNLINLRHIYFGESTKFPQGIRRFTCLRTLPYFSVGNEIGRRIEELAGLKQLKGELIVCNLEHVKNGEEAKKAMLEDKIKICHLTIRWTRYRSTTNNSKEEDILERLRPHSELESLNIENFMGDKFPSWMMSRSLLLNNLKKIQLLGCNKCEGVPPLGHLPNLTELKIDSMANLKCVGAEFYGYDFVHNVATTSKDIISLFPALKVFNISGCGDLIEWMEAPTVSTQRVVAFPCLEKLHIQYCSKLRNAPSHFPFLQKLVIISSESGKLIEEVSSGVTTLTSLKIKDIKELTCLPQGMLKNNNNLSSLEISDCGDLTCIASYVFGCCSSLERLVICNCEKLRHLADGLDTLPLLEELTIKECPSLELIPIIQGMTSLQKLHLKGCDGLSGPLSVRASLLGLIIQSCNNLKSIEITGGVTTSLQKLSIWDCKELSSLPALPQQCPSLQDLCIRGCPKVAWFGVQSSSISLQSFSDWRTFTSLRQLVIGECEGLESWVSGLQFPLSLERLGIWGIPNLEILPSLDSLNFLRHLEVVKLPKLKCLPTRLHCLPRLKELAIGGFEELDSFPDFQVGSLMHLEWLQLCGWPKLKSLPQQIQHLTSLTWLSVCHFDGVETLTSLQFPLSLQTLEIRDIPNLEILPSLDNLNSLIILRIGGFWEELDSFPDFQVGSLMHLPRLSLTGWPKLKSLPHQIQYLTSLTFLGIDSFDGVETLPEWLGSLTSLTQLSIWNCKNLTNLPSVQAMQRLTKLRTLYISGCHPLLKQSCSTDWPKISHIPEIIFN